MNKENLLLLADHLLKNVSQDQFDMENFRSDDGLGVCFRSKNRCGTAGCALGHAPFVSMLAPIPDDFTDAGVLAFNKYAERIFDISQYSDEFSWIFSGIWAVYHVDNTPKGAALRIIEMVENGVPVNWEEQMCGDEPYIFADKIKEGE